MSKPFIFSKDFYSSIHTLPLFISKGVMRFGKSLVSIFVPIYFYQLGYPIEKILLFFTLVAFFYVVLSYLFAQVVSKVGVNHAMLFSVPFTILYYFGLRYIEQFPELFFILPVVTSVGSLMMNFGYHMNYLQHSNDGVRGEEVSLSQIIFTTASSIAPFLGGLTASILGFSNLFLVGAIILFLGYIPLFLNTADNIKFDFSFVDIWGKFKDYHDWGNFISFAGYAIDATVNHTVWPIFVLIILGAVSKTGLIISLSTIISIILYAAIGEITDKYDKSKLINIGAVMSAIGWVGRIFVRSFTSILLVNAYGSVSYKILYIPWVAKSYDLADSNYEDTYLFIVTREIAYKASRVILLPLLALVFYIDFYPFVVSFITGAIFSLFYMLLGRSSNIFKTN